jgi:adenosylcobinamide-phosphate synthase
MSFFAILLALALEQAHPMTAQSRVFKAVANWAEWVARTLDAGLRHQAWVAWGMTVIAPAALVMLVQWLLVLGLGWLAGVVWNVALLYVTLGFRQFSHHFTAIRAALEDGDEATARELLAAWQQVKVGDIPRSEIVRHAIEYSVIAAHRHVFGVFFWYAVLSIVGLGPAGAVVYRITEYARACWHRPQADGAQVSTALSEVSQHAWRAIDWLPSRATALGFAIVGSFEDAMDGWRNHAQKFPEDNDGVILAATAGAINIQLGGAALRSAPAGDGEEGDLNDAMGSTSTPGRPAEVAHFAQVVGLVWRTVVMWLVLVALLTMAKLLG